MLGAHSERKTYIYLISEENRSEDLPARPGYFVGSQFRKLLKTLVTHGTSRTQLYRVYREWLKKRKQKSQRKRLRERQQEWSGREDLNLRPPGPELLESKFQMLHLVSLRNQRTVLSLLQLYRSCTELVLTFEVRRSPSKCLRTGNAARETTRRRN